MKIDTTINQIWVTVHARRLTEIFSGFFPVNRRIMITDITVICKTGAFSCHDDFFLYFMLYIDFYGWMCYIVHMELCTCSMISYYFDL